MKQALAYLTLKLKQMNNPHGRDHAPKLERPEPAPGEPSYEADHKAGAPSPVARGTVFGLWSRMWDLPWWARELVRKLLHIGVVVLALPLRWLGFWYGMGFAAAALVWNGVGMPRLFRFTFREDEERAGYSVGMLTYPLSVVFLMLFFPLPIAASQWATLSFGDGSATLIGRFFGRARLPWNREKTVEGLCAFLVMGTLGSLFFFSFTMPNVAGSSFLWQGSPLLSYIKGMGFTEVFIICGVSTAVAGFFESLPIPHVDDNVAAPLAGALTKLLLCYLL